MKFSYTKENTSNEIHKMSIFTIVLAILLVIVIGFGIFSLLNPTETNFLILLAGLIVLVVIYIIHRHVKSQGKKQKPREIIASEKVKVISS
ncbi:MAG TPA: hypothetical protein VJB05_03535 [archaeon]|nr:hypothetical protein [archaeon]